MQKIVPTIWFEDQAEEAARFYASLFPTCQIGAIRRFGRAGAELHRQPEGKVLAVELEIGGYRLVAMNGRRRCALTPAISLFATLEDESELDAVWAGLAEGGRTLMPLDRYDWSEKYGWVDDRYGVSWQLALGSREHVGGQSIVPSLLFVGSQHGRAEKAIEHYTSIFQPSKVEGILRYDGSGPEPEGTVMHAQFDLHGETFMAMDRARSHDFGFTEALSLAVRCETQDEIDRDWRALSAVPEAERCGWLKDAFGVSWQIVPSVLEAMLQDPDPRKVERVSEVVLAAKKLDLAALQRAYEG